MSWVKPAINGLEITEYDVQFRMGNGTFATTASCIGSDPIIVRSR